PTIPHMCTSLVGAQAQATPANVSIVHNGAMDAAAPHTATSPFLTLGRSEWAALAGKTPLPLTEADIARVRGLEDPVNVAEVDTIYRPLSRLLDLYSQAIGGLHNATSEFLGERASRTPFVIG